MEILLLTIYFLGMSAILVYSASLVHLWFGSREAPHNKHALTDWPQVTIQLPIYNEQYVITALLDSLAEIDYPRERLEIQVLDDSTDETQAILLAQVDVLRAKGFDVHYLHRSDRSGYKAGALAAGTKIAKGKFIAIFDADFRPRADFLKETLPHLQDPSVAAVQTRWAHVNEHESRLTKTAAMLLSLHFSYEQPRRSALGHYLNFNGTCGVWRKSAIADAGGWLARSVTEDIDLSYRAQLNGWRIVYLQHYTCPGEIPREINGFTTQQHRWLKGGIQNARLHLAAVMKSDSSASNKWHAAHHLLASSVFLFIFSCLVVSTPLAYLAGASTSDYGNCGTYFFASTIGLGWVFFVAQEPERRRLSHLPHFVVDMCLLLIFSLGMSVRFTSAAITGAISDNAEFVRTPKFGDQTWQGKQYSQSLLDRWFWFEVLFFLYLSTGLVIGIVRDEYAMFPLHVMALIGGGWVLWLRISQWCIGNHKVATPSERSPYLSGASDVQG